MSSDLDSVRRDWSLDFGTLTLRRRRFTFLRRIRELLWPTRYPLLALYRFTREQEVAPHAMSHPPILDSDNMTPTSGVPTRFELRPEWTIPDRDLTYLTKGPLTQRGNVLVPAKRPRSVLRLVGACIRDLVWLGGAVAAVTTLLAGC